MLEHDQTPMSSESLWHTVAEFSLRDEEGCEKKAAEQIAKSLLSFRVSGQVLLEAKQELTRAIEKEASRMVADQAQRTFTILLRAQAAQVLGVHAMGASHEESKLSPKGWGFFLTEKYELKTELGNEVHHIVISVYLYHEGLPA